MTAENIIKTGKITALTAFILGTIIFSIFYFTSSFVVLIIGYCFIIITSIAYVVEFIFLILSNKKTAYRRKIIQASAIMLLNIPVCVLYIYFASVLMNTMRMTFVNLLGKDITNVRIFGCENETIEKIEKDESKSVWIDIKCDCALYVEYRCENRIVKEEVFGYLTMGDGRLEIFEIK